MSREGEEKERKRVNRTQKKIDDEASKNRRDGGRADKDTVARKCNPAATAAPPLPSVPSSAGIADCEINYASCDCESMSVRVLDHHRCPHHSPR